MSKLTKAELMEGIFNTFKEKNDITNESRHIIENAIVSAAEKLDKHFKLEWSQVISSGMPLQRQRL